MAVEDRLEKLEKELNRAKCCNRLSLAVVFLLAAGLGCEKRPATIVPSSDYLYIKIDPNSANVYVMSMLPQINSMYEQTTKLMAQNRWLRCSLEKCIEKIEAERGLRPVPLKHHLPLKGDPNLTDQYYQPNEPQCKEYENLDTELLSEKPASISMLQCLINLHLTRSKTYVVTTDDWITNFEQRLRRIEESAD